MTKLHPSIFILLMMMNCTTRQKEVMVVGTIHNRHLVEEGYPLSYFEQIIDQVDPDVVLIESRIESYEKGLVGEAPIEMAVIDHSAKKRGILVRPIDWWVYDESLLNYNYLTPRKKKNLKWRKVNYQICTEI